MQQHLEDGKQQPTYRTIMQETLKIPWLMQCFPFIIEVMLIVQTPWVIKWTQPPLK